MGTSLDIYSFDNFSELLLQRFLELKQENPKFSYRTLAKAAHLKSQAFLHGVLHGNRVVSAEIVEAIARCLSLTDDEIQYAVKLSQLNLAKTPGDREFYARAICQLRGFKRRFPLSKAQARFYEKWYYVVIFEMISFKSFRKSHSWIRQKLGVDLKAGEIDQAISDLKELGLISETPGGVLKRKVSEVSTGEAVTSHYVLEFHSELLLRARQSLKTNGEHQREVLSLVFAVSERRYGAFRDLLRKFYSDAYELASAETDADQVYHLGLQLFPLTDPSPGS